MATFSADNESNWSMCKLVRAYIPSQRNLFVEPLDFVIPTNYSTEANWSFHSWLMVGSRHIVHTRFVNVIQP